MNDQLTLKDAQTRVEQLNKEVRRLRRENEDMVSMLEQVLFDEGEVISSDTYFEIQEFLRRVGIQQPAKSVTGI